LKNKVSEYSIPTRFIDLVEQQKPIRSKIDNAIKKVLDHGQYIMGPEVTQFEESLRNYTGSKFAYTCANGTDALTISMMALNVQKGDAVFVPSFTYVASAETVAQLGATPFFVDVSKKTFNLDPKQLQRAINEASKIGLRPRLIMPVELFGLPCDFDEIKMIADENNLHILIDSAQSFGGEYKGRKVGTLGDITTTSFFPAKPLGCYGDGGAIFTQDSNLSEKINSIRLHGKGKEKYDNVRIGVNSRLDTIQAAILLEKIKIFDHEIRKRNEFAQMYSESLKEMFDIPIVPNQYKSVWAQYTLRLKNRNKIQDLLKSNNIPTVVYYPKALSQQDGYKDFPCISSGLTNSEELPYEVLSLPMHPYLKEEFIFQLKELLQ